MFCSRLPRYFASIFSATGMLFSTFSLILHCPFPHPTLLYNTLVLPIFMLCSVSGIDVFEEQKPGSVPQYVNSVDLLVMALNLLSACVLVLNRTDFKCDQGDFHAYLEHSSYWILSLSPVYY